MRQRSRQRRRHGRGPTIHELEEWLQELVELGALKIVGHDEQGRTGYAIGDQATFDKLFAHRTEEP